jgi:hypothetical protein
LKELEARTGLPLRFFMPFVDAKAENYSIAERMLLKAGYYVRPSDVRWCSFVALKDD